MFKKFVLGLLLAVGVSSLANAQVVQTTFTFDEPTWAVGNFGGGIAFIDNSNGSHSCCKALTVVANGTQVSGGYASIPLTQTVVPGKSYLIGAYVNGDNASEDTPLVVLTALVNETGTNPIDIFSVAKSQVDSGFQYVVFGVATIPEVIDGTMYLLIGQFNGINEEHPYCTGQWVVDDVKLRKTIVIKQVE